MNGYMLDTNICIYIMNNRPELVRKRFEMHMTNVICVSMVTFQELYFGASKSANPQDALNRIEHFFDSIDVFNYDREAAKHAALIDIALQQKGLRIGPYDTQIAGHALSLKMVLVSNNLKEFNRVPDLTLENWAVE